MDVKAIECEDMDWILLAECMDQCQAPVSMVINLWVA
jgi:hypothetical protein